MKTYLVEEYSPDIKFDSDSAIVALTPKVCYQLNKAGIRYAIIEDYYDEVSLSAEVDEYLKSQFQWIKSLDEFLQDNVPEVKGLNLKLGTIYYSYIKRMVLDPLYIRCYALNKLFEAIKPSSITFISHPSEEMPLDFSLQSKGKSYYSQVIPILCNEKSIPLVPVFVEPDGKAIKEIKSFRREGNLISWLGGKLYNKSATVRRAHFSYKYFSKRSLTKQRNPEGLNIFMLKLAHIGTDFVIDAMRKGYNVYQLSDGLILKYTSLGARGCSRVRIEHRDKAEGKNSIWENTANILEGHDLIKRVNERYQLDVSAIVLSRLKYFVSRVCPEIIAYLKEFVEFYKKAEIDFVITPHEVSPIEFAAVAAANHQEHAKTVCISHGEVVYSSDWWRILELVHHDICIVASVEEKGYYRHLCQKNNLSNELYSSPDRLRYARKIGYLRESNKSNIKKSRIIYLPTVMMWDARRMEGDSYPDTWYYEFQKSLIKYFSTKGRYTFVWKGLPPSDSIYNPIPNFIRDNSFSNIEVATNPFPQHLLTADRVICDYPSTGFSEAIVAGVPTMSLYPRALILRKSAVDYFGNLLKSFSDIPEAIKHIDEFLNSDPELYKTTIDVEDNHILDILEKAGRKASL